MKIITLALGWVAAAVVAAAGQAPATLTDAPRSTIARFLERPAEPLTAFRAVRHLEATNTRFHKHGWMDVSTELSPESGFTYRVLAEGGSGYIRRKVLRPILDGEQAILARGDDSRSRLSTANYVMASEEPAEPGVVRLALRPLRREITLIDGAVFVTEGDADLVRVEGRLARNPSFWTTRVDIVRRYGRIAGVRVPLSIESTANVRLAGPSALSMTYRYETVNGRTVTSDEEAQ